MARAMYVMTSYGEVMNVEHFYVNVQGNPVEVQQAWVHGSGGIQQFWPPDTVHDSYTYYAIWAQSYSGNTANNSSHRGQLNYQGESSYHGEESSLWGFDIAQIRNDLAGRTIESAALKITSRWTYDGQGKVYHVMTHNHTTEPTTATFGPIVGEEWIPRTGSGSYDIPHDVIDDLINGGVSGFGLKYMMPGEENWGYCTGMYTTKSPVASPEDSDIISCPNDQKATLTFVLTGRARKTPWVPLDYIPPPSMGPKQGDDNSA